MRMKIIYFFKSTVMFWQKLKKVCGEVQQPFASSFQIQKKNKNPVIVNMQKRMYDIYSKK